MVMTLQTTKLASFVFIYWFMYSPLATGNGEVVLWSHSNPHPSLLPAANRFVKIQELPLYLVQLLDKFPVDGMGQLETCGNFILFIEWFYLSNSQVFAGPFIKHSLTSQLGDSWTRGFFNAKPPLFFPSQKQLRFGLFFCKSKFRLIRWNLCWVDFWLVLVTIMKTVFILFYFFLFFGLGYWYNWVLNIFIISFELNLEGVSMKGLNPFTTGVEKYFFHTIKLPGIDSAELGELTAKTLEKLFEDQW